MLSILEYNTKKLNKYIYKIKLEQKPDRVHKVNCKNGDKTYDRPLTKQYISKIVANYKNYCTNIHINH